MEELFKEMSQKIKIYLAISSQEDPYEKNESLSELPSLPIDAVVNDLSFAKVKWNMDGISTDSAKEIYIEKRNEKLLEQSYKIEIDGILYDSWKINGRMQKKQEGDYIRIYLYKKMA
jgi:hypothetical protein